MRKAFDKQRKAALKDLVKKAAGNKPKLDAAALQKLLEKQAKDGANEALNQVSEYIIEGDISIMLGQANEKAVAWASDHAAELVTQIDGTTRDGLAALVAKAEEEGWTNDQLSEAIGEFSGFDDARCDLIATTETAFADVAGNLAGWQESGVVEGKKWLLAQDEFCDDCAEMDGKSVGLDETFDFDGEEIDGPPGHPRCRCDLLPEVMSQEDIDAATEE
jgi:hypothetical protein